MFGSKKSDTKRFQSSGWPLAKVNTRKVDEYVNATRATNSFKRKFKHVDSRDTARFNKLVEKENKARKGLSTAELDAAAGVLKGKKSRKR